MNIAPNAINKGPVFRAGLAPSITAAQTTLPSMRGSLAGWFKPMTIGVVTETITAGGNEDGQSKPTVRAIRTSGVILPDDEEMQITPDGQRSWAGLILYVYPQLNVQTDSRIKIKGVAYRVMGKKDFTDCGYIRYKITEDYTNA